MKAFRRKNDTRSRLPNKSLDWSPDASGFFDLFDAAQVVANRHAGSIQRLGSETEK